MSYGCKSITRVISRLDLVTTTSVEFWKIVFWLRLHAPIVFTNDNTVSSRQSIFCKKYKIANFTILRFLLTS